MISVVKMDNVPQALQSEMTVFEKSFSYPLGESDSFRISHGVDYGRFFRSIGKSRIYLARKKEQIVGSMAVIERSVYINNKQSKALYIGDLKIKPEAGGKVLYCLIKEANDDFQEHRWSPHYSVVMKGGRRRPSDYTGRLGLPKFEKIGEVAVLRVPVQPISKKVPACLPICLSQAQALSEGLKDSGCSSPLSRAQVRSEKTPQGFTIQDKSAVCILEDTLAAKRLFTDTGDEIISGHLSSLQYWRPESGVDLIRSIMPHAHKAGYPALFFAVPREDCEVFCKGLDNVHLASANIFGRNMKGGLRWQINTAEI
jgi:hypothetical protein